MFGVIGDSHLKNPTNCRDCQLRSL